MPIGGLWPAPRQGGRAPISAENPGLAPRDFLGQQMQQMQPAGIAARAHELSA